MLLLFSCNAEIAKIDLTKPQYQSVSINCKKHRQIDFYLDCDIEYKTMPNMVIDFEFYKGNVQLLKGGVDPLNCSNLKNETKIEKNGKTYWKFYGKLEGNYIPPSDSVFTIYPTFIWNQTADLKIHKMDLIFVR